MIPLWVSALSCVNSLKEIIERQKVKKRVGDKAKNALPIQFFDLVVRVCSGSAVGLY